MKTLNTLRFVAPCFATCAKIVSRGRLMDGRTHHIDFPMALPLRVRLLVLEIDLSKFQPFKSTNSGFQESTKVFRKAFLIILPKVARQLSRSQTWLIHQFHHLYGRNIGTRLSTIFRASGSWSSNCRYFQQSNGAANARRPASCMSAITVNFTVSKRE